MVKVLPEQADGTELKVTVPRLKVPAPEEFEKLVDGVRVISPHAVAWTIP